MKNKITFAFVLLLMVALTVGAVAQEARPGRTPRWDKMVRWILTGQETLTYKTISGCLGLTVGADGAGYDVYFYGETASNYSTMPVRICFTLHRRMRALQEPNGQ